MSFFYSEHPGVYQPVYEIKGLQDAVFKIIAAEVSILLMEHFSIPRGQL
jgi:hypothetical protein